MSEIELQPCQWCGSTEAKIIERLPKAEILAAVLTLPKDRWCYVRCLNCLNSTNIFGSPEEAAEAWNRRV